MRSKRYISCAFFLLILVMGCQSTLETPSAPFQRLADPGLDQGIPVKVVAANNSDIGESFVNANDGTEKKLWYITSNPWAVQSAEGSVEVNYTGAGKLLIDVQMKDINGSFGGYPSIIYGRSPWNKAWANAQPADFPVQVKQMQELSALTQYDLTFNQFGGNIAYDLWLTEAHFPDGPNGGVEIMVWLWRRENTPLGAYNRTSTKLITVNGLPVNKVFNVYFEKTSAVRDWDVVTFIIDDRQGIRSGKVEIDQLGFINEALELAGRSQDLYLQDIEFGVEFTNQDQDFKLELDKFQIDQQCY